MAFARAQESELRDIRSFVFDRAEQQGGVFRRSQLSDWGIDATLTRLFARRRWWARLKHGVYCDTETLEASLTNHEIRHRLHCAIAVACHEAPTYAFGVSAALLHGLAVPREVQDWPAEVNRPSMSETRDRSRTLPGLPEGMQVHAYAIDAPNCLMLKGVPVVSRSYAALSLAAGLEPIWALSVLDSAAWQDPAIQNELSSILPSWSAWRGYATLKNVMPLVRTGAQTPLESISRYRLLREGVSEPALQHPVHDHHGLIGYVDMYWSEIGVVGEADGMVKYNTREDLLAEKQREDRLRALGLAVVRWTWDEIWNRPEDIARRIRNAARLSKRAAV